MTARALAGEQIAALKAAATKKVDEVAAELFGMEILWLHGCSSVGVASWFNRRATPPPPGESSP